MALRILTVVGARPQFVKAAAIARAIAAHNEAGNTLPVEETVVHTGQHYDDNMSDSFFRDLALPEPDVNLGVGSGSHSYQVAEMLRGLDPVLGREQPDVVVVYGDTNSTLAGALAAAQLHIPVAHVEAGLRSYRRDMPEELNRVVADRLATLLFCPSELARANLAREGIDDGVHVVGDVMLDVLRWQREHAVPDADQVLGPFGIAAGEYALVTVHRAGTADDPAVVEEIVRALEKLSVRGVPAVFPVHPRTRPALPVGPLPADVHIVDPVSLPEMLCLEANARVVLTDSGGVQKESFWLGVPCVTLRDETEWPETVEAGWNRLVGQSSDAIVEAALAGRPEGPRPEPYGDGRAAARIVTHLADWRS